MSGIENAVLRANDNYAHNEFGANAQLTAPPTRHFAILTCMDARMDPAKFAGLEDGEANIIRNAGGRASEDAIRSLIISYELLGTTEWFVIHHTECGIATITNEQIIERLARRPDLPDFDKAKEIDFLTFDDLDQSVRDDVQILRSHPLTPAFINIYGYIHDVKTGLLRKVV